jgi:hypothetical protein
MILGYLEGQMFGQAKNWSDIYHFFSDNGQSKMFHFLKKISTMLFA